MHDAYEGFPTHIKQHQRRTFKGELPARSDLIRGFFIEDDACYKIITHTK